MPEISIEFKCQTRGRALEDAVKKALKERMYGSNETLTVHRILTATKATLLEVCGLQFQFCPKELSPKAGIITHPSWPPKVVIRKDELLPVLTKAMAELPSYHSHKINKRGAISLILVNKKPD